MSQQSQQATNTARRTECDTRAEQLALNVAKLPKWAQRHIEHLERQLIAAEQRIEEGQRGSDDTDTIVDAYGDHPFRLPKHARVRFILGPDYGDHIEVHTTERRRGQRVVELHGGGMLVIRPLSGNLASAELDQR